MKYIKSYQDNTEYDVDTTKKYPHVGYLKDTKEVIYVKKKTDWSKEYLTIEAIESGTLSYTTPSPTYNKASYSLDNGKTWTELSKNTESPTLNAGEKMLLKGNMIIDSYQIGTFVFTGRHNVMGNPLSLHYGDYFVGKTDLTDKNGILSGLFSGSASLVSAENLALPATTLDTFCYRNMFYGCTALTTAPELPATSLASYCYHAMFQDCTSLTTAPELPATTLETNCYEAMFSGCTSLTTAPTILPASSVKEGSYGSMFAGCTSLTASPDIQAKNLGNYSCTSMFDGCSLLNYIKAMTTTRPNNTPTGNWVRGVALTGTFVKNANATWSNTFGVSAIPSGWTVVTEQPQ